MLDSLGTPLLSLEEWDFDKVPVDELRACLIWECARECSEFMMAEEVSEWSEIAKPKRWDVSERKFIENPPEARRRATRILRDLNFDLDQYLGRVFACHEGYNSFYEMARRQARPWSPPWQAIDLESRKKAVAQYNDHGIFPPLRLAYVRELESLWNSNSVELSEAKKSKPSPRRDDIIDGLSHEEIKAIEIPSDGGDPKNTDVVAGFTINFELYTDSEIIDSFREWLQVARFCTPPMRRGKKLNDDRAALDGIGMMRCLHCHSFSSSGFPEKFRKRGKRACYKGRKLALTRFFEVLPFLTSESRPLSWETTRATDRAFKSD